MSTNVAPVSISKLRAAAEAAFLYAAGTAERPGMDFETAKQAANDLVASEDEGFFKRVLPVELRPGVWAVHVVLTELVAFETCTPLETAAAVLIAREIVS